MTVCSDLGPNAPFIVGSGSCHSTLDEGVYSCCTSSSVSIENDWSYIEEA